MIVNNEIKIHPMPEEDSMLACLDIRVRRLIIVAYRISCLVIWTGVAFLGFWTTVQMIEVAVSKGLIRL